MITAVEGELSSINLSHCLFLCLSLSIFLASYLPFPFPFLLPVLSLVSQVSGPVIQPQTGAGGSGRKEGHGGEVGPGRQLAPAFPVLATDDHSVTHPGSSMSPAL